MYYIFGFYKTVVYKVIQMHDCGDLKRIIAFTQLAKYPTTVHNSRVTSVEN